MKKTLLIMLLWVAPIYAAQQIYQFSTPEKEKQFKHLTQELRCVVCQNESLYDSDAPLAADLRGQIAVMVEKSNTDPAIKKYLVSRYGEFILYKPMVSSKNSVLWFAPFLILMLSVVFLYRWVASGKQEI